MQGGCGRSEAAACQLWVQTLWEPCGWVQLADRLAGWLLTAGSSSSPPARRLEHQRLLGGGRLQPDAAGAGRPPPRVPLLLCLRERGLEELQQQRHPGGAGAGRAIARMGGVFLPPPPFFLSGWRPGRATAVPGHTWQSLTSLATDGLEWAGRCPQLARPATHPPRLPQVDQSGLGLPSRDYYLNRTQNEKVSPPPGERSLRSSSGCCLQGNGGAVWAALAPKAQPWGLLFGSRQVAQGGVTWQALAKGSLLVASTAGVLTRHWGGGLGALPRTGTIPGLGPALPRGRSCSGIL